MPYKSDAQRKAVHAKYVHAKYVDDEQLHWDKHSPQYKRHILAVDNGKNYGNYKAPDGNENNIYTTKGITANKDFIWRYRNLEDE